MADIPCYGACGGDPSYRQEGGVLPCGLCGGSGKLPGPKTAASVMADYVKLMQKVRLSHSAIVAGDVDAGPAPRARKRFRLPKRRVGKKQKRAAMRAERRWKEEREFLTFRASRPPDWEKQLDELKAEFRRK